MEKEAQKIVTVIMGQDCEKFLPMCLESVKDSDVIVFCDGGSKDKTKDIVHNFRRFDNNAGIPAVTIENHFDKEDSTMNGKQRNFYLDYIKENYPGYWCLALDADEVVEDFSKIKEFINTTPKELYSVKMRHFIQDLAHEDATHETHFVPNRLFKIESADKYPEVEHPVLQPKKGEQVAATDCTTIWHLAYIPNLWAIKERYRQHMAKSDMHTPEFLKQWYHSHIFGKYPTKEFNPVEVPDIILDEFGVDKDELYFAERGIDMKHPLMVKQWYDYFKPEKVLDLGCGRGPYLFFWKWFVSDTMGIELSAYACKNNFGVDKVINGSAADSGCYEKADLITAIDILEHLNDEDLDKTLKNMADYGNKFLFSIPFEGDPNLYNDPTHLQFRSKEDWIKLIESHGIKIKETPKDWLFAPQLLVGERK